MEEVLRHDLPGNARRMGERITAGLRGLQAEQDAGITEVRSAGLWTGIEFQAREGHDVLNRCREHGGAGQQDLQHHHPPRPAPDRHRSGLRRVPRRLRTLHLVCHSTERESVAFLPWGLRPQAPDQEAC